MPTVKQVSVVIAGLLTTGALLSFLGSGMAGEQAKKFAQFITNGYGVN
jgi:hypothetical protein